MRSISFSLSLLASQIFRGVDAYVGQSCTYTSDCGSGEKCYLSYQCKKDVGEYCSSNSDCYDLWCRGSYCCNGGTDMDSLCTSCQYETGYCDECASGFYPSCTPPTTQLPLLATPRLSAC